MIQPGACQNKQKRLLVPSRATLKRYLYIASTRFLSHVPLPTVYAWTQAQLTYRYVQLLHLHNMDKHERTPM